MAATRTDVEAQIARRAPGRRILVANNGWIEPAVLLDPAAFGVALRSATAGEPPTGTAHATQILATVVELPEPLDPTALIAWLDDDHGLLRAKGTLTLAPEDEIHELQLVGRRWALTPIGPEQAPASERQRQIVVLISDTAEALALAERALLSFAPDAWSQDLNSARQRQPVDSPVR